MSTKGLYGIRKNGTDKAFYNRWDSYPEDLGLDILKFIKNNSMDKLNRWYDNTQLVSKSPTNEQILYCIEHEFCYKERQDDKGSWRWLLFRLNGDLDKLQECLDENIIMYLDNKINFIKDSLYCEYAYIINLDKGVLEFYEGFQMHPDVNNRYGTDYYESIDSKYYPCKLVLEIPLEEIKKDDSNLEDFVKKMR